METNQNRPIWQHAGLIIPLFLVAANLICGFIAVEFRYPSLWGGSDVFNEYAMPLSLSWALAHWPSMLLACALLFRMPELRGAQVSSIRLGLLIGIACCIAIEFLYGGGRFHRIPFVLFFLVDLSLAYVLSLLLYKRPKPMIAALFLIAVTLILVAPTARFEYEKYLYDQKTKAAIAREAERTRRIEEAEKAKQQ